VHLKDESHLHLRHEEGAHVAGLKQHLFVTLQGRSGDTPVRMRRAAAATQVEEEPGLKWGVRKRVVIR